MAEMGAFSSLQVKHGKPAADPPRRVQLVAFVQAYAAPIPRLQSDFQCISARIGQVLCCALDLTFWICAESRGSEYGMIQCRFWKRVCSQPWLVSVEQMTSGRRIC